MKKNGDIYIYIYRERERERDIERSRESVTHTPIKKIRRIKIAMYTKKKGKQSDVKFLFTDNVLSIVLNHAY